MLSKGLSALGRVVYRLALFIVVVAILGQIMAGSQVTINYNTDRAKKVKQDFWARTMRVATKVGDFKHAIWR